MIVGKGSLSKLINDRMNFLFFVSGIADSRVGCDEDRKAKHERESKMLFNWIGAANHERKMLVYFGTISKFMDKSYYIDHKLAMEAMIRELSDNFTIINLGNVWECTNPNTFMNAMKAHAAKGGTLKIFDEYKYMISKEQLNFVTDNLPRTGKHEISIFGEMKKVKDCL